MIKIENVEVVGLEPAIRGMRNPMNSWDKSDSSFDCYHDLLDDKYEIVSNVGPNDLKTMQKLAAGGSVHGKFKRMIVVYMDITAPLYWWKEFDTYKVGTVANSCSTMHKIHDKEFELDDFSCEHLIALSEKVIERTAFDTMLEIIDILNFYRELFIKTNDKQYWWQMIQLLPSSYNQRRTVMLNYEVLTAIYRDRKNHKLDEWHGLCEVIVTLPYSELITEKPTYV